MWDRPETSSPSNQHTGIRPLVSETSLGASPSQQLPLTCQLSEVLPHQCRARRRGIDGHCRDRPIDLRPKVARSHRSYSLDVDEPSGLPSCSSPRPQCRICEGELLSYLAGSVELIQRRAAESTKYRSRREMPPRNCFTTPSLGSKIVSAISGKTGAGVAPVCFASKLAK